MTAELFALLLNRLFDPRAVYLFPEGPYPYEIRKEARIRIGHSWYLYDGQEQLFRETLERTDTYLGALIEETRVHTGCHPDRVFLLGFSMGAYTGYYVALRHPERFAGLVAIGGRMKEEFVQDMLPVAADSVAVLILHGEEDLAVPIERAHLTHETLRAHGFDVEMQTFARGHELHDDEIRAARAWFDRRFPAPGG